MRHFLNQGSTPVDCQAISLPPPANIVGFRVARTLRLFHHASDVALGLNVSLRRNTAQAMRASLLANATTAAFLCTLARSARNHPPSGASLLESVGRTALAPWIRNLRR